MSTVSRRMDYLKLRSSPRRQVHSLVNTAVRKRLNPPASLRAQKAHQRLEEQWVPHRREVGSPWHDRDL